MDKSINSRIADLIKVLSSDVQKDFAEKTGIKKSTLNAIVGDRQMSPNHQVLSMIVEKYTNVDPIWLLTGKGGMLKEEEKYTPQEDFLSKNETLESLRKERDALKDKLLTQHERYQILLEKYNQLETEIRNKKQA